MKLSDSTLTLAQIEEGKWCFFEVLDQSANAITGIKLTNDDKIFVQYIGGDFEEPYQFWFEYNQSSFNEMWQYEFRSDFSHPLNKEIDSLGGIHVLSTSAYTMIHDLNYACQHMGEVEVDVE